MSICIRVDSILLRQWRESDADSLSIIGNDENVEANMNDGFPKPYSIERAIQFIQNAIKSKDIFLAIEKNGKIIGSIGAFVNKDNPRSAVIAYFIGKEYWNQGYASSAIKGIIEYLKNEKSINEVTAEPFERNIGSRRALEKNGFVLKEVIKNGSKKNNMLINTCRYQYLTLS